MHKNARGYYRQGATALSGKVPQRVRPKQENDFGPRRGEQR